MENITRREIKYLLTNAQFTALMHDLDARIIPNKYSQQTIHNIYFDNARNTVLLRSLEQKEFKDKLRARVYEMDGILSPIFVELKKKFEDISYKRRLTIDKEQSLASLIDFHTRLTSTGEQAELSQIESEIADFIKAYNAHPKTYIGYDRNSYKAKDAEELRFTFDRNIRVRTENIGFHSDATDAHLIPIASYILEIKCGLPAYPLWLVKILSAHQIYPSSFSKYTKAFESGLIPVSN